MKYFITHIGCLVIWLGLSCAVQAEEALYQKIALKNIDKVRTQGFITVDILQGNEDSAQFYRRKNSINTLRVTTEKIDETTTLHLKEIEQHTAEHWDKTPIAHVIITLRALSNVEVHDTHKVNIKGFNSDFFTLHATGHGFIEVSALTQRQLKLNLLGSSTIKLSNISADKVRFNVAGSSKVALENFDAGSIDSRLVNQGVISTNNLRATSFKVDTYYKTRLKLGQNTTINSINLKAFNQTVTDFTQAEVNVINALVTQNAIAKLGKVNVLSLLAKKNSVTTYQGEPTEEITINGNAVVSKVVTSKTEPTDLAISETEGKQTHE